MSRLPPILLSFCLATLLPRYYTYAFAYFSVNLLLHRLLRSLILFATYAFVTQCTPVNLRSLPSPLAFRLVSSYINRTLNILLSPLLTPSHLLTFYTQFYLIRLVSPVLPRLLAQNLPILPKCHFVKLPLIAKYSLLLPLHESGPSLNSSVVTPSLKLTILPRLGTIPYSTNYLHTYASLISTNINI